MPPPLPIPSFSFLFSYPNPFVTHHSLALRSIWRWLHRIVHHGKMFSLLEPKQDVRCFASFFFLRLHGRAMLWSSVDARSHWVFVINGIRAIHLQQCEDRLTGGANFSLLLRLVRHLLRCFHKITIVSSKTAPMKTLATSTIISRHLFIGFMNQSNEQKDFFCATVGALSVSCFAASFLCLSARTRRT